MRKLTTVLVTVLMIAGLATSALAAPGWSNHPRNDYRFKHEQPYQKYDHRDYRRAYRQPVIVHRVPVNPPRRFARVYQPVPPGFGFFFPYLNIQIR